MAGCHRGFYGLRCVQLLWRTTTTGVLPSVSRFANALPHSELGPSSYSLFSGFSSSHSWDGAFSSFSQAEQRTGASTSGDCGWSAWRHLVERSVHSTNCRQDDDKDDESRRKKGIDAVEIGESNDGGDTDALKSKVAKTEARDLVHHVHVSFLKQKLQHDSRDTISYQELLELCRSVGMAPSTEDATRMVDVLNQAGVVLIFRDKVHLHPEKIVELVANVLPLSLLGEDDQRRMELSALALKKEEIDMKAHKQMRLVLWSGLCGLTFQVLVFFRLTFWDLSWDVMEPIAFFTTATGIICGYAYFMFTSRDPSYQDLMQRIFQSRQQKLFKLQNFDYERFKELQMQCQTPITRKKILEHPGRK